MSEEKGAFKYFLKIIKHKFIGLHTYMVLETVLSKQDLI